LLDHRWWASDGPTGGYLLRLAIEAADPFTDDEHQVRAVTLRVLRQALPAAFTSSVSAASGTAGLRMITVTFTQHTAFAAADLLSGPAQGQTARADTVPPPARPASAYLPMVMRPASSPPVTTQFWYRPAMGPDGTGPRPGWDAVWVSPSQHPWFLLAIQLSALNDGYHLERHEIWSAHGNLLAAADILRRARPSAAGLPDDRPPSRWPAAGDPTPWDGHAGSGPGRPRPRRRS
jgi:hypothetical protein